MTKTIGLIIAYDGTNFSGWQRQEGRPTIQGTIEEALTRINGRQTLLRGASRTDAGVHAEYQIAAFETDRPYDNERWKMALNATTPRDITIRTVFSAPDGFQPRFESRGKHYRYLIWQGPYIPPMLINRAALSRRLDTDNMRKAASHLIGEHDFSSFRAVDCQAKSPVRTITRLDITHPGGPYAVPCNGDETSLIQIDVEGTAFLKQMVRIIVGTLMTFGHGRPHDEMVRILEAKSRAKAGETAPAAGLTLVRSYGTADDIIRQQQDYISSSPS